MVVVVSTPHPVNKPCSPLPTTRLIRDVYMPHTGIVLRIPTGPTLKVGIDTSRVPSNIYSFVYCM